MKRKHLGNWKFLALITAGAMVISSVSPALAEDFSAGTEQINEVVSMDVNSDEGLAESETAGDEMESGASDESLSEGQEDESEDISLDENDIDFSSETVEDSEIEEDDLSEAEAALSEDTLEDLEALLEEPEDEIGLTADDASVISGTQKCKSINHGEVEVKWSFNSAGELTLTGNVIPYHFKADSDKFDNSKVYSIIISNGTTVIEENAFYGYGWYSEEDDSEEAYNYETVDDYDDDYDDNYDDYDSGFIQGYSNLKKVKLPDTIKEIGYCAFGDCEKLTQINLPDSLTKIDDRAFVRCGFTEVTLSNSINLGENVFSGSSVKKVVFKGSVTSIAYGAFKWCTNLTQISIPGSVTNIKGRAFEGSGLKSITLPSALKQIGIKAFADCTKLTGKVVIPGGVTEITYAAFADDTALQQVVINSGVKKIGYLAYGGDSKLKEITIPKSVSTITKGAIGYRLVMNSHYEYELKKLKSSELPTIKCYANSAAHKYAVNNGIPYKLLDKKAGKKVTVTFNGNGGTVSSKTKKVTGNYSYGTLPTAKKKGYTLTGWYTKKSGGTKVTALTTVTTTKNQTLYAHWKLATYKITYKLNGGKLAKGSVTSYKMTSKTFTLKNPTRNGYTFKGWYLKGKKVTKITKGTTGNITLEAKWKKKS